MRETLIGYLPHAQPGPGIKPPMQVCALEQESYPRHCPSWFGLWIEEPRILFWSTAHDLVAGLIPGQSGSMQEATG